MYSHLKAGIAVLVVMLPDSLQEAAVALTDLSQDSHRRVVVQPDTGVVNVDPA